MKQRRLGTTGLYVSHHMIPTRLVRPGVNILTVRMTAAHLWLPVYSPLHDIWVGYYETPRLPGLSDYQRGLRARFLLSTQRLLRLRWGASAS